MNKPDTFLSQTHCDRCKQPLGSISSCSWFNTETICTKCEVEEDKIKMAIRDLGQNAMDYEGCGVIPKFYYACEDCLHEWTESWTSACDDECPLCGKAYSPYYSVDLAPEDV
jgi:hypothetical protein